MSGVLKTLDGGVAKTDWAERISLSENNPPKCIGNEMCFVSSCDGHGCFICDPAVIISVTVPLHGAGPVQALNVTAVG